MVTVSGGCHCGNIGVELQLTRAPDSYSPRACGCDFCRKHGAAYVSDPDGALHMRIADPAQAGRYRQGSGQADKASELANSATGDATVQFDLAAELLNENKYEEALAAFQKAAAGATPP